MTSCSVSSFCKWHRHSAQERQQVQRQRGVVSALPEPVRVDAVEDKGTLILLTPERLTPSNPEHVALAHRIQRELEERGLLRRVVEQRPALL